MKYNKVKYVYNSSLECFEREDGKGKKIWVNITEANRIVNLYELGNSISQIQAKMTFNSSKATPYSVRTIIEKFYEGTITLDGEYPAPTNLVDSLTDDARLSDLEDRVFKLEKLVGSYDFHCKCEDKESFWDYLKGKVKFDG